MTVLGFRSLLLVIIIIMTEALFDIRVVDTDARSYHDRSPRDVLGSAEVEKKRKYLQACQDRRTTFTPLCVSVDGLVLRLSFLLRDWVTFWLRGGRDPIVWSWDG